MESLLHDDFEIDDDHIEADTTHEPLRGAAPAPAAASSAPERFEQRRFAGGDTLDESVLDTIARDAKASFHILKHTLLFSPPSERPEWDLWGPLVFCLVLSLVLSFASSAPSSSVFSSVFAVIWLGQAMVVYNIRLLGGTISYLHALSVSGYSLFPLVVAASVSAAVHIALVRLVVTVALVAWAVKSCSHSLGSAGVLPTRVALASYPVGLFYCVLGWMCVVV